MGKNYSPDETGKIRNLAKEYEAAQAEGKMLYLDADQLAAIANYYCATGQQDKAEELLHSALQVHPNNTDLLLELSYYYLDRGKRAKAKNVADCISETYSSEVKMLKAEILLGDNKLKEAQRLVDTIEDTDDLDTLAEIVYLFLETGHLEIAKKWLDKGKELHGEEEDYLALSADYYEATHDTGKLKECFNKLIDKSPYSATYWMGLAKCYFIEQDIDKTMESCDFALAANEEYGEAFAYKAHSYFYLNNFEKAVEYYKKAIEYHAVPPEMGDIFLAMSYAAQRDWANTQYYCQRTIDFFEETEDEPSRLPFILEIYTTLATALAEMERYEEAHQLCREQIARGYEKETFWLTEGKIYLIEKKLTEAAQTFRKTESMFPIVEIWYEIGNIYSEYDYIEEAKEYYLKVYEENPRYHDVSEKLSVISILTHDLESFVKYNKECNLPFNVETIKRLLASMTPKEEDRPILQKLIDRLREERDKEEDNK